jgi:putative transposase
MTILQKLSSVRTQVHNHINQERHLISRDLYRERRSTADQDTPEVEAVFHCR